MGGMAKNTEIRQNWLETEKWQSVPQIRRCLAKDSIPVVHGKVVGKKLECTDDGVKLFSRVEKLCEVLNKINAFSKKKRHEHDRLKKPLEKNQKDIKQKHSQLQKDEEEGKVDRSYWKKWNNEMETLLENERVNKYGPYWARKTVENA